MTTTVISTKGQVVIPAEFRKRFDLKPNSKVLWVDSGGTLLLYPRVVDPVAVSRGLLKGARTTRKALSAERRRDKKHGGY